jgi:GT2 family glycosyltransferase/tetratricopeptide (TPR) repeat protein/glycosyltransferase involved in cell wall biosynthesis/SAM-dependent methyltransferase
MGEIFTVERPASALEFTGERMTSVAHGQIEYEHLHRYCFARLFCRGKTVVDVAAGEGYGSALLAQVAKSVIGVEMAPEAVGHAVAAYPHPNLSFVCGDARRIPLQTGSADVVVSFETIEHLYEQEQFLAEIRRILRPDGLLIISSPDSEIYSREESEVNPFHVRELTAAEFKAALQDIFPHVQLYSQRTLIGSAITIDAPSDGVITFERRDRAHVDASRGLSRAPYVVAVASADDLGQPCQTLYIDLTRGAHLLTSLYGDASDVSVTALIAERNSLKATLEERDDALVEAEGRIADLTARERAAVAELQHQRRLLPHQRVAAQLAAAEGVQEEVNRLRDAVAYNQGEADRHRELAVDLTARLSAAEHHVVQLGGAERAAQQLTAELQNTRFDLLDAHGMIAVAEQWPRTDRGAAERDLAAAMATIADLTAALATQTANAQASVGRESLAIAELERQRIAMTELVRQYDAAQLSASQVAEREIASLRDALARAARQKDALTAEFEAAAAQRVADISAQMTTRSRTAAQTERLLRTRIDELQAELARAISRGGGDTGVKGGLTSRGRPRGIGASIRAGDRELRAGNPAAAAQHYRDAVGGSPGLRAIWVQLGHALKEQGDYVGAEGAYRQALSLDGSVADTHLQLGHLLKLMHRWIDAANAYTRALQLDPAIQDAANELDALCPTLIAEADKAREAAQWATAALYYRQAIERQPWMSEVWSHLGQALQEQGDYAAAETAHRQGLRLDQANAEAQLRLAELLAQMSRWDEAAGAFLRAQQLAPDASEAATGLVKLKTPLTELGDKAADQGKWAEAIRYYRPLLDRDPHSAPLWLRLATALAGQDDHAGAEEACRRALALDPSAAGVHLQLGRLLELQGRQSAAIDAYAAAVRLASDNVDARTALRELMAEALDASTVSPAPLVTTSADAGPGSDVIWLGVIDWHWRIQRPQHLAANLAGFGARVFYVSLAFEPSSETARFRIVSSPHPGVYEVKLRVEGGIAENLYRGFSAHGTAELQLALDELIDVLGIRAPVVVVDHPEWHEVACGVPGGTVVYDCLDLATGFSSALKSTATSEMAILNKSDVVVVASRPLVEHVAKLRPSVLVRNAADVDAFAAGYSERAIGERPVVGYFGAISDWFNIDWLAHAAAAHQEWDFRLVGRTDGCNVGRAAALSNVKFLGERPYGELPKFLRDVDVAVIPFKLIELIRCTNPVKLYEYMAAGKPVVAAAMPEVVEATDLVYIAEDAQSFADGIARALAEDSPPLRLRRLAWAREHTWKNRVVQLRQVIDGGFPLVSVIVLTYNNWHHTEACLASLCADSDYPALEIIVVDNASTDETGERLVRLQRRDERVRVVLNDSNLGFAAGNNVGLRLARGEFVILLNNDTVVTRGWVRDLIRPLQRDPQIGMTGPLTNSIGNEQKVKPGYKDLRDMPTWARQFVRRRLRRTVESGNIAFFCVAMRRSLIDEVGLLDEAYGIGFYEDDDYCRRVKQAGYRMVIVDDVFVHHHLSASIEKLGAPAIGELMERNRAIFEARWGPWEAHRYRDEPGFGA